MFNFSRVNVANLHEEGYEFEVKKLDGTGTGAFIKVRGPESKVVKDYGVALYKEFLKREAINKGKNKPTEFTAEELDERTTRNAVNRIISWRGFCVDDANGNPVEKAFTPELATELLSKHTWIRPQIIEAADDVSNFRC
jgi:hypothetical protein